MDPGLVAAAFHDGSDARVLLERGCGGKAVATLAECHETARSKGRAGAWEVVKELVVGLARCELGYLRFEARNAGGQYAQLRQQSIR